ncbi:Hypothetical protein R9X50_00228400 [Acrodontium crateriforme]|uniref:Uncharacterized protein n=1 Tax=Acrodontium crateriforme TaxID=150365 RepID=A0AAQ3M3Z4_9PEZI|nr:Hypothetical protein R9X50_00228400 [Acrodontium crateriforme]
MSSETINPISPERFALALQDLPVDALHAKATELENSLKHLRHSNEQMLLFAEQGDADCRDAMFENLGVIGRITERVALIKAEVERRGLPWTAPGESGGEAKLNGVVNGADAETEGETAVGATTNAPAAAAAAPAPSGRLTDDELRRQLEAEMGSFDDEVEDDPGFHL